MAKEKLEITSDFSFFSKKELKNQKYIHELNIIINKYNILENENLLIASSHKSFLYLINYVLNLKENKLSIAEDIKKIFLENIFLKDQINSFFQKKLENITKNNSLSFFKEINLIFSILELGTNERVLDENFDYNFESISKLFKFYESLLKELFISNIELFYSSFDSYTILLETFIPLSKMNSLDIKKRAYLVQIFDLITETISTLKFNIALEEESLKKLNRIQGRYLFYFSHLDNITIDKNNINLSIEKYFLSFEKQTLGYKLYSQNISKSNSLSSNEILVHRNFSSILILNMLQKLDNILPKESYFNTEYFQKILKDYYEVFFDTPYSLSSKINLITFKKDLISSLCYNYSLASSFVKIVNYHSIIEDFINSEKNFNSKNLESIYNLLKFIDDIDILKIFFIVELLTDSDQIKNEYDEFYKLSIFQLFIDKKLEDKYFQRRIKILKKIKTYINKNKAAFQLNSIYDSLNSDLKSFDLTLNNQENKSNNLIFSYLLDDDSEINY